jgi:hypothetical protein
VFLSIGIGTAKASSEAVNSRKKAFYSLVNKRLCCIAIEFDVLLK